MRLQSVRFVVTTVCLATLVACGGATSQPGDEGVSTGTNVSDTASLPEAIRRVPQYDSRELCPDSHQPGVAHCLSRVRAHSDGSFAALTTPGGFGPSDLASAYNLPATGGDGVTVAIVDAQDDPSAEADLATYRSTFGLPPCTTANGCFKKVNQNGVQGSYPTADQGWAGEIALDLDMVSAACPSCKILLVEATSANMDDLGDSVNTAVNLGATVISNSYGGPEDSSIGSADSSYFHHAGVAIFASSGDDGYGVEYPASSQYVTAVGGTSLAASGSSSRGWVESVWGSSSNSNGGAGSGCSAYIAKPSWQGDSGCGKRMVADVSAVADPNTGVAVYDQYGSGGWQVYGGTSVASPLVAAIYARTGHVGDSLGYSYANTSAFYDVTSGTNGTCSSSNPYFCKAVAGYDGPTGNGTPNGAAMVGGGGPTNAFSVALNPTTGSGAPGSTVSYSVGTTQVGTTGATVALSVSGLPSGVTGAFSPASVSAGASSTLTLTLSSSAAAATTSFTVKGTSGSESHTATGQLTVTSTGGGGGTTALTNGVAATNLSAATGGQLAFTLAVPAGATGLSFKTSGGTGDADLYVKFGSAPTTTSYDCRPYVSGNTETCTIATAQAGTYHVMLNAYAAFSGVSLTGAYTAGTTGSGDFSLSLSSSTFNLTQGGSQSITVHTAGVSGATPSLTFRATSLSSGVSATFTPATVTAGQDVTLKLTASASATVVTGDAIRVYGDATGHSHYKTATVSVASGGGGGTPGDFSLSLSNNHFTLAKGGSQSITVSTAVVSGGTDTIALSATSLPSGVTATFGASSVTTGGSTTLTLHASSTAAAISSDQIRIYGKTAGYTHYKIGYVTVN